MNPSPTAHLRLIDRLSREWYVFKVEFLAQDIPSGYRKERRHNLTGPTQRRLPATAEAATPTPPPSTVRRRIGPRTRTSHLSRHSGQTQPAPSTPFAE
jgi:hypothetical protein